MSVLLPLFFAALSAAAAPAGFSGDWTTTFGDMTLTESAGVVRGTYQLDGFLCELEGKIEGGVLRFVYKEDGASGDGRFRLAADKNAFKGEWRRSDGKAWNPWVGTRRKAVVDARGFEGLWDTNFGRLRIRKSTDGYAGVYSYADGILTGREEAGVLKFRYRDAKPGTGEFAISDDGRSLRGRCRADGATAWEDWGGTRVEPVPGRRWLVVVESRWESSLAEQEYSYGEMLKTFFARTPRVQVRQRFFTDKASLAKWMREATFLSEPTVLYLSSHGTTKGLLTDSGDAGAEELAAALKGAENLTLLHFGACEVMKGSVPAELFRRLGTDARFPLSGFAEAVDWAASAVVDFMYLDLILSRDLPPSLAAEELGRLMPFAAKRSVDSNYDGVSFRLLAPPGAAR